MQTKIWLMMIACAVAPLSSCPAQTLAPGVGITLTSTHFTSRGALVSNATASFTPTLNNGTPTSYRIGVNGGQVSKLPVSVPVTFGYFTVHLADVSQTMPPNLCYAGVITDNATGEVLWSQACLQPTATASWCSAASGSTVCNFNAAPLDFAPQIQVQPGPTGAKGDTGPQGMMGPQGSDGPMGPRGSAGALGSATVVIHSVQALPPGSMPTVVNSGVSTAALLDFGIPNGVPGVAGAKGDAGVQGIAGPAGIPGVQGAVGAQGVQGLLGPVGPSGAAGLVGPIGPSGLQGVQGLIGPAGSTGPVGPAGVAGATGAAGVTGAKGATGLTGATGANGIAGAAGATGPTGPIGAQGIAGSTGVAGAQGVAGAKGDAGLAGATGATGAASTVAGPQGVQGAVGPQGVQGAASTVPGPAGSPGQTGSAGAIGPAGPAGAQGAASTVAGPAGAAGAAGATGATTYNGSNGPFQSPALNGTMSAFSNQSGTNTRDGIAKSFLNSICATIAGCTVAVENTYPFDAERSGFNGNSYPGYFTNAGQHVIDRRGGGEHHIFLDTQAPGLYESAHYLAVDCYQHQMSSNAPCLDINMIKSTAGYSLGNTGVGAGGWNSASLANLSIKDFGAGITAGIILQIDKTGIGDINNYSYINGQGGLRAASDEALELHAVNGGEKQGPAYTGTVTSITGNSITVTASKGANLQGVGRMLINRTNALSGCLTAQGQMQDDHGVNLPVTTFTLGCGASIPTSTIATAWGLLDTDVSIGNAILPSTSPTSVTTVSAQFSEHSIHGHPAVGNLGCFAGQTREDALVTAVTIGGGTGGDDLVTYALRKAHPAGSVVVNSPGGCAGLELKANTIGDPDGGNGLRYVLDVLGPIDAHTIAVVQFTGAASNAVKAINMTFITSGTTGQLVNTGGMVMIPMSTPQYTYKVFQGQSVITISGSDTAAFNGQCTNVHTLASDTGSNLYCTQAASTGLTSATSSATLTIGDTGYGNTRFNMFPSAEVLDVQNYQGPTPRAPNNDPTNNPDTFRLEPNGMGLTANASLVEEPHDYAAGYYGEHVGFTWYDPYASEYSNLYQIGLGISADSNNSAMTIPNYTPLSYYVGSGGVQQAPHGFVLPGIYQTHGEMTYMPYGPIASYDRILNCPPTPMGCTDARYSFDIFSAPGNGDSYHQVYYPAFNTLDNGAAHETFSRAPTVTGPMKYACFNSKMELVAKTTPCDQANNTGSSPPPAIMATLHESMANYAASGPGVNLGTEDYFGDNISKNLIKVNPSFGPQQYRMVENVYRGTTTSFTTGGPSIDSAQNYDGIPANFAAGWTYVVTCKGNTVDCAGSPVGSTGTILSNTVNGSNQNPTTGPTFTLSNTLPTALGPNDVVNIVSPLNAHTTDALSWYPSFGWQPGGNGTVSIDTVAADLPPALSTFAPPVQCLKLSNAAGQTSSITTYFDTAGSQYAFSGGHHVGVGANILSGSGLSLEMSVARSGGVNADGTVNLSGTGYHSAGYGFTGSETVPVPVANAQIVYTLHGTGSVCLSGATLTADTDTNPSPFRNQVLADLQFMKVPELRWHSGTYGTSLLNSITPSAYRQTSASSQGSYGTVVPQQLSMHDELSFTNLANITRVKIVVPNSWNSVDASNLVDYLNGPTTTVYGAYRAALGQTSGWASKFSKIVIEDGNEVWNESTFAGSSMPQYSNGSTPYWNYLPLAKNFCAAMKANPNWNPAVMKCSASVQTAVGANAVSEITRIDTNHAIDMVAGNEYGMFTPTTCTQPQLFVDSFTEAWQNDNDPNSASGMAQLTAAATAAGMNLDRYEYHNSTNAGSCTQAQLTGYPEGEGYGLTNILMPLLGCSLHGSCDSTVWQLFQQQQPINTSAGSFNINEWGVFNGSGGNYNNGRPTAYALSLVNGALLPAGYGYTGTNIPTYSPAASNGINAETNVPYLQFFPTMNGKQHSVIVVNTNPAVAYTFGIGGDNLPVGTVTQVLYTSPNLTDSNEVASAPPTNFISTSTLTNPASFTLGAHSAAAYTWTVP